jgi:hypothetical protein
MEYEIIGIAGVARAGKDSLFKAFSESLKEKGVKAVRLALADELKKDIDPFLLEKFGISAFTADDKEKEIIRPMLVAYGKGKRIISKGTYWTKIIERKISELKKDEFPIITDIRYDVYETDEVSWLLSKKGFLVHVSRLDGNHSLISPANDDERDNDPKIKAKSHISILNYTVDNLEEYLQVKADDICKKLF